MIFSCKLQIVSSSYLVVKSKMAANISLVHNIEIFCVFPRFRSTLPEDARQYYCRQTQLLEFPIFVRQHASHSCKPEFLKIYAFALVTDYALELKPSQVLFGTVSTLETVKKEIYLTNHSLAVEEYGFLNLPKVYCIIDIKCHIVK